jgi:hypothetical protein
MSFFEKFKQVLALESSSEKTIAFLADSISLTEGQALNYEGIHSTSIENHLNRGKTAFGDASNRLKQGDDRIAMQMARQGVIHLHIAQSLLSGNYKEKVEPEVSPGSPESFLHDLTSKIAKTKLVVEYGDLKVSTEAQESLNNVITIFDAAVKDLTNRHLSDARRGAQAARVALHWTVGLLEVSNQTQPMTVLQTRDEGHTREEALSCELADKIIEAKIKLSDYLEIPEVAAHMKNAETRFASCLENIIDDDKQSLAVDCRAGLLDVNLATKAADKALKNSENQELKDQNLENSLAQAEFKQEVSRILKLVEKLDIDSRSLKQRLEAALLHHHNAQVMLNKGDLITAERLAREAHLDLDFAWNLANALTK